MKKVNIETKLNGSKIVIDWLGENEIHFELYSNGKGHACLITKKGESTF